MCYGKSKFWSLCGMEDVVGGWGGDQPPPHVDALDFQAMVANSIKNVKSQPSKFVKKLDEMLKVLLLPSSSRKKALTLVDCGLIGNFVGVFFSLRTMSSWLEKKWKPLIKGSLNHFFCGREFFAFLLKFKEDQDLIF
jgi:hypothetical protein